VNDQPLQYGMHIRPLKRVGRFQRYLTSERGVSSHAISNHKARHFRAMAFCDRWRIDLWPDVLVDRRRRHIGRLCSTGRC
jgi:hypothetical protein